MRTIILVDGDNTSKEAGTNLRFDVLLNVYGDSVVRCLAYFSFPSEMDRETKAKRERFYAALRLKGVCVMSEARKTVTDRETGITTVKGFPDATIACDAALFAHQVDRIVLVTGDSDFTGTVQRIQQLGTRVEVIGIGFVAHALRTAADRFRNASEIPGLIPDPHVPALPVAA
jgi:uncharacterized LabA/DUF88 family protein